MDSHTYNGLAPRRVGAFPSENPLRWTGAAELSDSFVQVPIDLRSNFHSSDGDTWYKPPRGPAVDAAIATRPFQVLLEFVQWPLWVVEPTPELERGTRVTLLDLRFGTPRQAGFAATAIVNDRNQIVNSQFGMGQVRVR
jgi:hypothetical protein